MGCILTVSGPCILLAMLYCGHYIVGVYVSGHRIGVFDSVAWFGRGVSPGWVLYLGLGFGRNALDTYFCLEFGWDGTWTCIWI